MDSGDTSTAASTCGYNTPLRDSALDLSRNLVDSINCLPRHLRPWTPVQVAAAVEKGRMLILFESGVYDVTRWIQYHPGGRLAIEHMVGRDATDVMLVSHSRIILNSRLRHFCVGRLVNAETVFESPSTADEGVLDDVAHESTLFALPVRSSSPSASHSSLASLTTSDPVAVVAVDHQSGIIVTTPASPLHDSPVSRGFRELHDRIKAEGLMITDYTFYAVQAVRISFLFFTLWALVLQGPSTYSNALLSGLTLAMFWHQASFIAHDTGHNAITHDLDTDHMIGVLLADFLGGLSIGWWKSSHNVHHLVTNDPEHDPDIQHLPFFAVSTRFFNSLYSTYYGRRLDFDRTAQFLVSLQNYLYYPAMLFGRFNLYVNTFRYIVWDDQVRTRKLEAVGMVVFWTWYCFLVSQWPSWGMRVVFILVSHMLAFLLHVQLTLSHFAMSTEVVTNDEEFVRHQLRTSMDVNCPPWMDWFHGGLQFQVEHHLFPRVPRHNLRTVQKMVLSFCQEHKLEHHAYGFVAGNALVVSHLKSVADQVSLFIQAAKKA